MKSFYKDFAETLKSHPQIYLAFYSDLWLLSWKPHLPHNPCGLTKNKWYTSGKSSSFFLLNKETRTIIKLAATVELKYKRIVLPCCCTTSKHKTLFQNHKQPYHVKTCLALKIRRTTAATYYDLFSKAFLNKHSDHFNQILYKLTKPFQLTWK